MVNSVNPTESVVNKLAIREEVKQIKVREKRKPSIDVKRLEGPSGREFLEVFEDVWRYILGPYKFYNCPILFVLAR